MLLIFARVVDNVFLYDISIHDMWHMVTVRIHVLVLICIGLRFDVSKRETHYNWL